MNRHMRACVFPRFGVVLLFAALLAPMAPAQGVRAAALHVTGCGDSGTNTLRGQLAAASNGDVIVFDQNCTIALASTLTITVNVTIDATGAQVVLDGGCTGCDPGQTPSGGVRVLSIPSQSPSRTVVTLIGLTIQHGKIAGGALIDDQGGGIDVESSSLTLVNCTIRNNVAAGGGGAVHAATGADLTVTNSTFSGNAVSSGDGGGINQVGGTLAVTNSTFSGNTSVDGGGIFSAFGARSITNSTISGNTVSNLGGGLYIRGNTPIGITGSTIVNNAAGQFAAGGGIYIEAACCTVNIRATIVANNTAFTGPDAYGSPFVSGGYNLIGNPSDVGGFSAATHDVLFQDPALGPLATNGGPTATRAPSLNGSPAVDAIPPAACPTNADQRGVPRPQGTNCDIGAVEIVVPTLALNIASGAPGATVTFSGSGFRTGLALKIAGVSATGVSVAPDGNSFTATVPSPHTSGAVPMIVENPDTTTANATFTYTGANLTSIAIAPTNPSIAKGTTQQFTATGTYSDTTTADITSAVTWQSGNSSVATIANTAGNNGVATGVGTGASTITATLNGVTSNNQTLTVTAATLSSIAVTPANAQIAKGTTQQFTATGAFSDGSHQDLTTSVTWASNTPGIVTVSNTPGTIGLATGASPGTATITATLGAVSGGTSLAVTDATLTSIAVTPASPAIAKGTSQQFTATGTFSDGSTQDLTSSATWSATGGTGSATISNSAGTKGRATGTTPGTGITIAAAYGGKSGIATLGVTAATLTSIAVTPGGASVPRGMTQQFTATGTFSDGTTQDLTATATWASTNSGAAANPSNGLATGVTVGTTTITASQTSVTSPGVTLTVTNATLASIAIAPTSPSIAKGTNQQFIATGTYSDASTANITSSVQWQSSDPTKATINAGGQATGVAAGSPTITATLAGVTSNTATLTVTAATLTSIAVTPANPVIAKGTTRQFTATATFSDSTTQDLTTDPTLTWQSDTASVATISSSGATKGQATAVSPGTARITATRGSVSGSTTLTVTNAVLTGIAVAPANSSIAKGATQQFTAIGAFSDGTTADLTSSVTWVSSNQGVATISNAVGSHGLATAVAAGTTTITATQGGVTSNGAALTVTKTLQSIAVTPANPSVKVGATVQLTATGAYSDNTTPDVTAQAQWSTSDPNVASVDASGKVTAQSPGVVTIKAVLSGVTGQTQVTVMSPSPIGINPAPAPGPRSSGASVGGGGNPPAPAPTGR